MRRRNIRQQSSRIEALETRALLCMTANLVSGVLTVEGTAGDDQLAISSSGADVFVQCPTANQTFPGASVTDIQLNGLAGNDILDVSELDGFTGTVSGGDGDDTLTGQAFDFYGDADNDRIVLSDPAGVVDGGSGNDYIDGSPDADLLVGGTGDDTIEGSGGNDTLMGEEGNDSLVGAAGRDSLVGGDGNDTLVGGNGQDTLEGLAAGASPTVDVDSLLGGSSQDLLTLHSSVGGHADGGVNDDTINGSTGNDTLIGGDGHDSISAAAGDDSVTGGAGNDTLLGSGGSDTISGGGDDDFINGGGSGDSLNGGSGHDAILGGSGNDVVLGGAGLDFLVGESGTDDLDGEGGDDILIAGTGTGLASDWPSVMAEWTSGGTYANRTDNLRDGSGTAGANGSVFLNAGTTVSDDTGVDTLTGNGGQDWFFANSAIDSIFDQAGDELLEDLF